MISMKEELDILITKSVKIIDKERLWFFRYHKKSVEIIDKEGMSFLRYYNILKWIGYT